mgnify:CR=1 FL=1
MAVSKYLPTPIAGNGDAANGGTNGNVWLVHFTPDETGVWNWQAEFMQGTNIAQNGVGDPAVFSLKSTVPLMWRKAGS